MRLRQFLLAIFAVMIMSSLALAGPVTIFVGYADNLRPSPFFPSPWSGDASVGLFAGGGTFDAGAVRIRNDGATPISIDALTVTIRPAGSPAVFTIWGGSLPYTLAPGMDAIFTQTFSYNFDTSDFPIVPASISDNCSVGPTAATAICTSNAPVVAFTLDGVLTTFSDSAHVLDTGGFDAVCCLPDGNESLGWRKIGTTGVGDPAGEGGVPEPGTMSLVVPALGGLYWLRRRKK